MELFLLLERDTSHHNNGQIHRELYQQMTISQHEGILELSYLKVMCEPQSSLCEEK